MDGIVEASIDNTRFTMLVLSVFAVASAVLAGVGLPARSPTSQHAGIRRAPRVRRIGRGILRLVIREGCARRAGRGARAAGAMAVTARCGVAVRRHPLDGLTIASVVALVAAVALVAVGLPAWRAGRVDPATALRAE
jgi:hypothetical protein